MKNETELRETKEKSEINLSNLEFKFCLDQDIELFYEQKLLELKDKEKWIEENGEVLKSNKQKIYKMVQKGILSDDNPEAIYSFVLEKTKKEAEKVLQIKNELEKRADEMCDLIAEKLSIFLPDWVLQKGTITFRINETSDFCVYGTDIVIDIKRLQFQENPFQTVVNGAVHEVFHIWFHENEKNRETEKEPSDGELKEEIVRGTINEGMAVFVSGQSLEGHHTQRDIKDYKKYIGESFLVFKGFRQTKDRGKLEKFLEEEFKNMGHFYVVGNEIAKAIIKSGKFGSAKEIIIQAKENPEKLLDYYMSLCEVDLELPKI